MKKYTYIIVGGGMTAGAAISGIREIDGNGSVLVVTEENALPYNRPPLSKKLWAGGNVEDIFVDFEQQGVDFLLNTSVLSINPELKRIIVSSGETFSYEQMLLATGGNVKHLPIGENIVNYYRTIKDYQKLKDLSNEKQKFAVIGAGFIGSEIAAALAMNDNEVALLETGEGIGWKILPKDMVQFLNEYYREKGVEVRPSVKIESISKDAETVTISFEEEGSLKVNAAVAGIGINPNVDLAKECGISVQNGIQVNEILQTSEPSIYAAGDVANFYNPLLERRIRVEHADNAKAMGRAAGKNMAEANEKYTYLPLFYSDMFDLGYEAVGILDSRLEIVADWQEKYYEGVLYYLENGSVVGVLLWNVWGQTDAAREIIGSKGNFIKGDLKGLIT